MNPIETDFLFYINIYLKFQFKFNFNLKVEN